MKQVVPTLLTPGCLVRHTRHTNPLHPCTGAEMPAKQRASTPHDPTDTYEPEDDEHANDPLLVPEGEDFEFEFTFEEEAEAKAAFALPDAPETIPLDQKTIAYIARHKLLTPTKVRKLPKVEWFIEPILQHAPLSILHGTGGTKKSFLALDWCLCAAHGLEWHGHYVRPGKVLYIVGEGISGIGKRLDAWENAHDDLQIDDNRINFLGEPLDLYGLSKKDEKGNFPLAVEHWRAFIAHMGYDYVVVDTLHRNAPGAEENSATDIGRVFSAAQRIAGDAHLIFLHHEPKERNTARGSGSIHDDADNVVRITKDAAYQSTLHSEKLKDAEDFQSLTITFEKDDDVDSLFVSNVGTAEPRMGVKQRIVNICKAEPGKHTREAILCMIGDNGNTQRQFKSLVDEKAIVKKGDKFHAAEGEYIAGEELSYVND